MGKKKALKEWNLRIVKTGPSEYEIPWVLVFRPWKYGGGSWGKGSPDEVLRLIERGTVVRSRE